MIDKKLYEYCQSCFQFLVGDYGFTFVSLNEEDWGFEFLYKTNNVGVALTFEHRDFYLFVKLCRLQNGDFPPEPGEITSNTSLECFDLDDLVLLRSKHSLIPPHQLDTKLDASFLKSIVRNQSENLKNFANDVLKGNFSIFPELDKIVKERAKKAAIQKWGC